LSATLAVTGKYPTTTAITAVTGATPPYSITATVTGFGGNTSPAGTVSFLDATDSNSQLGSASLASATFVQSFAAKAPYATEEGPTYVAVGDFDEDGIPDLAVANNNSSSVSVLLGKGDGTFKVQIAYATGTAPASVAVGDFNGDGIADLAVANLGSNNVSVLLGKGDGTFKAQVAYATGTAPFSVAVGDFNGDGIADLAVANSSDNTVSILLGKGDGTFNTQVAYATGSDPNSVAVGDFNKDGIADLAIANLWDNDVSVLLGNGDGTFQNQVTYAAQRGPTAVAVGDFNGDGIPDLAVANCGSGGSCGEGMVSVYLGNGDGTFQTQATYVTGSNPASIAVGDFNGDGIADLATANAVDNNVSVLLGNGDGTFKAQVTYPTGSCPFSIAVGSFNGDGIPDLAVASTNDNAVSVLLGAATNTATGANTWSAGRLTHQVIASYPGSALYTGSTSAPASLPEHKIATTLTLTASPDYSVVGTQVTLTATLAPYSAQGYAVGGTEIITFQNGATTLGTALLSNGVATLNVSTLPAGHNSLTASYAGDPYFAASSGGRSYMVGTGVAVGLAVSGYPSPVYQGVSSTANVTANDVYGNLVTSFNGTVVVTTSDSAATVSSPIALTNGVGTVTVTFAASGTQTITASATGMASGSQTGIVVQAAPVFVVTTQLDVTNPTPDCASGNGSTCSLRDALLAARTAGAGSIKFSATTFAATNTAAQNTITLGNTLLITNQNIAITGLTTGSGSTLANLITVSGGGSSSNFSLFRVASQATAAIANLNIANANSSLVLQL
jgi:hypothetical protein